MANFPQVMVPVFPAGYGPAPSDFTGWAQDATGFCATMPLFRGQQKTAGQAMSNATFNALQIAASDVQEDPFGGWSPVATSLQPAWSWLAPFTGWYQVTVTVHIQPAAVWLASAVQVSGGTTEQLENALVTNSFVGGCWGDLIIPMAGGIDYVQAGAGVSAAVNTSVATAGLFSSIEIAYVSSG